MMGKELGRRLGRRRVFRALLWKEWRQLRMLRWGAIALGLVLPPAIAAGAEIARRGGGMGWGAPFDYTAKDLYGSALPAILALGVWPLVALLLTAQAFAGDRSGGTESFLLDRPVPRSRVFGARLLGSAGSVALVIAATLLVALGAAALSSVSLAGAPRSLDILGAGLVVTAALFLGGVLAGTLVLAPLAAVLAGMVLIAATAWMTVQLVGWTAFVRLGEVPFALVPSVVLVLAYPAIAWWVAARGEPAGRGRVRRGLGVLLAGLALLPVVTFAGGPLLLRWQAHGWSPKGEVEPSRAGDRTAIANPGGAWIVDSGSGEKRAWLGSLVWDLSWSGDGSLLGIVRWKGAGFLVEVVDGEGRTAREPVPVDSPSPQGWVGDTLVVVDWRTPVDLLLIPGRGGPVRTVTLPEDAGTVMVTSDPERLWLVRGPDRGPIRAGEAPRALAYRVHHVDAASGRVEEMPLVEDVGNARSAILRLSPSGRWWWREDEHDGPLRILEIATGREITFDRSTDRTFVRWLPGDRLAIVSGGQLEHGSVALGSPEGGVHEVLSGSHLVHAASPDGTRILVSEREIVGRTEPERRFRVVRQVLVPVEGGPPIEVPAWPAAAGTEAEGFTGWAGPDTLYRSGAEGLAFEALNEPGRRVCVLGDCGDWAD